MEIKTTTNRKWRSRVYHLVPAEIATWGGEFTRIIDHRNEHIVYHQEIELLQASGSYTIIHRKSKTTLVVCKNIGNVISTLSPTLFFRIDRSTAINVRELAQYIDGRCGQVVLNSGATYKVAARRRAEFLLFLSAFASNNNLSLKAKFATH